MRSIFPIVLLGTLLLLACNSASTTADTKTPAGPSDASAAADVSSSLESDANAQPTDAAPQAGGGFTSVRWGESSPLKRARDHHTTFMVNTAAGRFLYVAGGRQLGAGTTNSVERAQVSEADGSLSPWVDVGSLPSAAGGSAVAQDGPDGQTVVLIGGTEQNRSSTKVLVGTVDSAGNLALSAGPSLAVPRFHATAAVVGKYVYVFGGFPDNSVFVGTDEIERAELVDGRLGAWVSAGKLPALYTHQATVAYRNSIYLISGTTTTAAGSLTQTPSILRSRVAVDGTLSSWEPAGALPAGRSTHAATVSGAQLVVAGGANGDNTIAYDELYVAGFASDGTLLPFRVVGREPVARMHLHQAPMFQNHMYLAGGMSHDAAQGPRSEQRVDIATLE